MVQLNICNQNSVGDPCLVRRFPFRIGRSQASDLCLPAPGVWDRHAEIRIRSSEGFELVVLGEAWATVNDRRMQQTLLRNGDLIGLGSVQIQFTLSPTSQRPLHWREWMIWLALTALSLGQVALVYWLPT